MDDNSIISRLFDRQEDALADLQADMDHRLQRTARNILPTEADVEECLNDTYLAVWNSIPPKRPPVLTAYVLRLCKNIAVSKLRQLQAQKRSGYEIALDELQEFLGTDSLENTVAARVLGQAIDQYLSTLNKDNRILFIRRYWHGDSVAHLAQQNFTTQGAISARLHRMKQGLRDYLTKEGLL